VPNAGKGAEHPRRERSTHLVPRGLFVGANRGANDGANHRLNPWRGHDSGLRNDPGRRRHPSRRYTNDWHDSGRDHAVGRDTGRHDFVCDHTRNDASCDDYSGQTDRDANHHAHRYSRRVSEWPVDRDRDPVITLTG